MKTLFLAILAVFCLSMANAQEPTVELEDVTVSSRNAHFLRTVQDEYTPEFAIDLQTQAAAYDLISSPEYRGNAKSIYFVEFQTDKGSMYTSYDNNGEIIRCLERYKDVPLPVSVRDQVFEDNNGYSLDRNLYTSIYKDDRITKRLYRVHLTNGKDKKEVTINLKQQ